MIGNKRNFSLTIWDHEDNFLCTLKSANSEFEGQSYEENFNENINGEKVLTFSVPMYIFNYKEFVDEEKTIPNRYDKNNFIQNEAWKHIYNEQKIRYIEYNEKTNNPERIEEFVLKNYTENRNGEQKIATCTCESLAVYELGKIGWTITWDTDYVTNYDFQNIEDNLTLDYWMRKLFYKETNLGRVSNTTECTYLLQGLQLRNNEGYPISDTYSTIEGKNEYVIIDEPICSSTTDSEYIKYKNLTGWSWEVIANFENDPEKQNCSTLYEPPVINKFIESSPNYFIPQSYQKRIGESDDTKILRKHPISNDELNEWTYVTSIKRHLMNEERSNVFSIIQDLGEQFEVWPYFIYKYDNKGKITERKILFKSESIDEDIKFDFSYGKNLQSCSRILDSSDLITKLYVTNTDSALVDGSVLSIQQATANPTGENYIYNFKYFLESGMLTKEENFGLNSDEYKINLHCGKLRNINNKIINLQKYLSPLYSLQMELESDLVIQEGAKTGYVDNIQSIEDKIAAIPPGDQYIKSWSNDNTQYNHVGESKTFTITTHVDLGECKYINFGRDDILIGQITTIDHYDPESEQQVNTTTLIGFVPRAFKYDLNWHSGDAAIAEDNTSYFTLLNNNTSCRYDYSELGNNQFIKGIYFSNNYITINYSRLRYKYAPLAYYYLLILDYQDKIKQVNQKIDEIEKKLLDIQNKILVYELELKNILKNKNELILQFEKDYKPYIREGYWEPSDYKPESINKIFYTDQIESNFDGFVTTTTDLREMRLNDSLNTYTRYFSLGNAAQIDVDSVNEMITYIPIGGVTTAVTRLRGLNYELYRSSNGELLGAISPELIDKYDTYGYDESLYEGTITYQNINSTTSTVTLHWIEIPNNIKVNENYIYISDDNIITSNMKVYGGHSTNENDLLEQNIDWTYQFESSAFNSDGDRVSLSTAYLEDVFYDYSIRIDLKLSNKVNQYLNTNNPKFTVSYDEETTLQYLYNDAVVMSDKYAMPRSEYSISVVDLSSLNGFEYYKPKVGQLVPIWDIEMGLKNFEGFITSVSFPLEEKYNTQIEITTYNTKFEDVFQKLTATVTSVEYNENELNRAADAFEATTGAIKTEVFQKSLEDNFNRIQLGNNNEITIDKNTGITLRDAESNNGVKIIGNGIFLTEDINKPTENIQWKTGITGAGINANAITAGNIDTKQVNIWNASERQVRFVWNEQGLFAYGDKFGVTDNPDGTTNITTEQDLIDYNKFVKFNQEGLDFTDHNRSALKLGWNGLKIQTQNESLNLDAETGLVLQQWNEVHTSFTTRLELGKLDSGKLYGLRLRDTNGNTTFQSDSQGDLWLHRNFQIGGTINPNNVVQNANAGVYGLEESVPGKMQMGFRRGADGVIFWDSTPIRFWAGRQSLNSYTTNIHATAAEINAAIGKPSDYNTLSEGDPTFAKFKVSANGDILASGIDVGGWVGQGNSLRSNDFHAILRSNDYGSSGDGYPVLAIGKPTNGPDTTYGSNYNFRVYKSGKLQIGGDNFVVDYNGNVTIKAGSINIGGINTNSSSTTVNGTVTGTVGGMTANADGLSFTSGNYTTAIYKIANSTSNAFVAGPTNNPTFKVNGNGILTATGVNISGTISASTGDIGGWQIGSNSLYKTSGNAITGLYPNSSTTDAVIFIGSTNTPNTLNTNTKFKVTGNGGVYFHGGIYGWSTNKNTFRQGLNAGTVNLRTDSGDPISVEINQGLIIDIR